MKLYYHHVGEEGARRDFPKTVFDDAGLDVIERAVPATSPSRTELIARLRREFPGGRFNCWGVPAGATPVIRNLSQGDVVLLVESVHITGAVPALCEVRVFLAIEYRELSQTLWGDDKYPYVFFFRTERLRLTWVELLEAFGYKSNFDPRGKFYSVGDARLTGHGGPVAFVSHLRRDYAISVPVDYPTRVARGNLGFNETTAAYVILDSESKELETLSLTAEPRLTDHDAEPAYRLVKPRDAAFRLMVMMLYQDACAACGLKLHSPDLRPEVQAAHIYPKALHGSDDLRNGIALCRLHHWAFDVGWFTVADDARMLVRPDVPSSAEFRPIKDLSSRQLREPSDRRFGPHHIYLSAHRRLHGFD